MGMFKLISQVLYSVATTCMVALAIGLLLVLLIRVSSKMRLRDFKQVLIEKENHPADVKVLAFFHPFCDAGGGGEKVLFNAIRAFQNLPNKDTYKIVVYCQV